MFDSKKKREDAVVVLLLLAHKRAKYGPTDDCAKYWGQMQTKLAVLSYYMR